jgi:transcription initiation protein SPT3
MSIKLPWELTTVYTEALRTATANIPSYTSGNKSDDEDEDEMEAHEDSLRRLKVGHVVRSATKAG